MILIGAVDLMFLFAFRGETGLGIENDTCMVQNIEMVLADIVKKALCPGFPVYNISGRILPGEILEKGLTVHC